VAPEVGVDPDVGGVAEPEVVATVPVAAVVSPGLSTAFVLGGHRRRWSVSRPWRCSGW
jgi:hypothetical protein